MKKTTIYIVGNGTNKNRLFSGVSWFPPESFNIPAPTMMTHNTFFINNNNAETRTTGTTYIEKDHPLTFLVVF